MKTIDQTYSIQAPLSKVWQAFVDPSVIEEWGGGPAEMNEQEGTLFSLWGGEIFGTNTKIIPNTLIAQDWFSGEDWTEPSKLTLTFSEKDGSTIVELHQDNVPDEDVDDITAGWQEYYLGPLTDLLETE